ncbi:MAG: hypothetical protein ACM3PZ_01080 [Bacillota bacterium]
MFSYRFFLKQAWNITKNYRHLWFFGIFATFVAMSGEYQIIGRGLSAEPGGIFASTGFMLLYSFFNPTFYAGLRDLAASNLPAFLSLLTIILLTLALIILFAYLAVTSQAALVEQSARIISSKKKPAKLSIPGGLTAARPHFWKVLALNIIGWAAICLSFSIISLPLAFLFLTDSAAITVAYLILFLIFVPIAISIALIIKYAIASRVLDGGGFTASMARGWKTFRDNWLVSFEMGVILFVINFLVGIATLIVISIFFLPLLFISLQMLSPFLTALSALLIIGVLIFTASVLNVFQISSWTALYVHLQSRRGASKIERIFAKR